MVRFEVMQERTRFLQAETVTMFLVGPRKTVQSVQFTRDTSSCESAITTLHCLKFSNSKDCPVTWPMVRLMLCPCRLHRRTTGPFVGLAGGDEAMDMSFSDVEGVTVHVGVSAGEWSVELSLESFFLAAILARSCATTASESPLDGVFLAQLVDPVSPESTSRLVSSGVLLSSCSLCESGTTSSGALSASLRAMRASNSRSSSSSCTSAQLVPGVSDSKPSGDRFDVLTLNCARAGVVVGAGSFSFFGGGVAALACCDCCDGCGCSACDGGVVMRCRGVVRHDADDAAPLGAVGAAAEAATATDARESTSAERHDVGVGGAKTGSSRVGSVAFSSSSSSFLGLNTLRIMSV
eukprot:Rhum_TRINITY_DN14470_c10_g2::Rhum_TRINITY_DN14470_c10_g2_i1::g.91571::m.91571